MFAVVPKHFIALLLASVVGADYNLTCLDIFWFPVLTFTLVSSNSIATTYSFQCATTTTLPSTTPTPTHPEDLYTDLLPQSFIYPTDFSMELPVNAPLTPGACIPLTMFQGPETFGFRLADKKGGYITLSGDCSWTGVFTDVPITCDAEVTGSGYTPGYSSGAPTVFGQSDLKAPTWSTAFGYAAATVVEKTGPMSANGEGSAKEMGAASKPSEGGGGRVALPVGTMVMAGGALVVER